MDYETEVLREQDTAVAEHLAQLEALAAALPDPASAEKLRRQASTLRRVSTPPLLPLRCSQSSV